MWNCKLEGMKVDIFPDFVLISTKGGALPELAGSAKGLPPVSTLTTTSASAFASAPKLVTKSLLPPQLPVSEPQSGGSLSQIFVGGAATTAARAALDEATYEPQAQRVAEAFAAGRNDEELYLSEIFCFISCGNSDGALRCCEKALSFYPLNSTLYYIKASLLTEVQNYEAAVKALQQAVFVSNDYIIAYFALFSLNRRLGRADAAKVHLANTMRLLSAVNKSDPLLDGDGLTAGQLEAIVRSIEGGLP
jgi:tetratricopeptide (TPR) repeat protein